MTSRRQRRLEYWLAHPRPLLAAWRRFHAALAEVPIDRKEAELQRAKMPPGGVSWPLWPLVLNAVVAPTVAGRHPFRRQAMTKTYRQGDVLLVPVDEVPKDAKRLRPKRVILAEGEVTGHVHELVGGKVDLYCDKAEVVFVKIMEAPEFIHAEHATQVIESGIYRIVHQREYTPAENVRVAD